MSTIANGCQFTLRQALVTVVAINVLFALVAWFGFIGDCACYLLQLAGLCSSVQAYGMAISALSLGRTAIAHRRCGSSCRKHGGGWYWEDESILHD